MSHVSVAATKEIYEVPDRFVELVGGPVETEDDDSGLGDC